MHVPEICPKNVTNCCATEYDVYHIIWQPSYITHACVQNLPQKCDQSLCVLVSGQSFKWNTYHIHQMHVSQNLPQKCDQLLCVFVSGLSFLCNITYNKCMCPKICPKNVTNCCLCPMSIMSCAICIICNKCMCSKICPKNVTNCCVSLSHVYHIHVYHI